MIINEPYSVANDPSIIINEGATCYNCPWYRGADGINDECLYHPRVVCPIPISIEDSEGGWAGDYIAHHDYPQQEPGAFCSHHPGRLLHVSDAQVQEIEQELERPVVDNPQAMGYNPDDYLEGE